MYVLVLDYWCGSQTLPLDINGYDNSIMTSSFFYFVVNMIRVFGSVRRYMYALTFCWDGWLYNISKLHIRTENWRLSRCPKLVIIMQLAVSKIINYI